MIRQILHSLVIVSTASFFSFAGVAEELQWESFPDFSHAGYRGGGVPIPDDIPTKIVVSPVSGDDTSNIQDALDQVGLMPLQSNGYRGAVLLSAGTYQVTSELNMSTSGVVLRGESETTTIIEFDGNGSNALLMGGGLHDDWETQVPGTIQAITTAFVPLGSRTFAIADTSDYSVGDEIVIWHKAESAWFDSVDQGGVVDDAGWEFQCVWKDVRYRRVITEIDDHVISVDAPVFMDLDAALASLWIYQYDRPYAATHLGIEDFTIRIVTSSSTDQSQARTAVYFRSADDSWARRVTTKHFWGEGFRLSGSVHCTIQDCSAIEPHSTISATRRYNFSTSAAQLILFQNCYASFARHAFVSNGHSRDSGNVYLNCEASANYAASESHQRWVTGLLYDNIVFTNEVPEWDSQVLLLGNRGDHGNAHGWAAANSVAWRCDVSSTNNRIVIQDPPGTAQNYAIGCLGTITGDFTFPGTIGHVEVPEDITTWPVSLYEAQLTSRESIALDTTAPTVPANLSTTPLSNSSVDLSWIASFDVSGIAAYRIYRDGVAIASTTNTVYSDKGLLPGLTYQYSVRAVDVAGNASALTPIETFTTAADLFPPSAPQNLAATVLSAFSVELQWEAATDDFEIAFYRIFDGGAAIGTTGGTSYTVTGLGANTSHLFTVRAVDLTGKESGLSNGVFATTSETTDDSDLWLGLGFEEEGGNGVLDVSGNGHDGSFGNGVERVNLGQYGNALDFDGTNGRVDLGTLDIPGSALTIAAWIRPDNFGTSDARIISKATGVDEIDHYWMLSTVNNGEIKLRFRLKTISSVSCTLIGSKTLLAGVWTHVAATYDGAAIRLYVNGVLDATLARSGMIVQDPTVPVAIGDQPQGDRNFDGLIDDVRIYLRALDEAEINAAMGETVGSGEPDIEPPSVPQGVQASVLGGGEISLSWNASTDNTGVAFYRVLRDELPLVDVTGTGHVDATVAAETTYAYRVLAFDASGNASGPSSEVVIEAGIPSSPEENVVANGGFESGISSWSFYTNGTGSAAVSSPGYLGTGSAAVISINTAGTNTQLFQNGISLAPNTDYRLTFAAYSSSGRDLRVSLSKHSSPYTNYGINRERMYLTAGWQIFTIDFTTSGFGSPVSNGRLYFWFASDAKAGDVYHIDQISLATIDNSIPPDEEAPSAPSGLDASLDSSNSAQLSWSVASDNVGVLGYIVYRNGVDVGSTSGTSFLDGGLDPSSSYTYTVVAFDEAGNESGPSNEVTVSTPNPNQPPSTPGNLQANGISETQVSLSWNPSTDDGSVSLYRIFRDSSQIGTSTTATFVDSGMSSGESHQYQVMAVDDEGSESALSLAVTGSTLPDTTSPSVPAGVQATGTTTTSIQVTWLASTDNYALFGYRVYRDGNQVAEITGTSFLDSGLLPDASHTYTIKALDAAGNTSGFSDSAIGSTFPVSDPGPGPSSVSNGDFEAGMSSWTFYTSGSGSAVASSPGYAGSSAARITINNAASNIQLFQNGVSLEPNTDYRLTFAAYSSSGRDLRVSLSKHSSPYTNYGINRTRMFLETSWQTFTLEFTTSGFGLPVTNGRFYFWFASDAKAGDVYYIDQIILAPIVSSGGPDEEAPSAPASLLATLASDTAAQLTWQASSDNVGVSGYTIYRDGIVVGSTAGTSFLDEGLNPSESFAYTVRAVDVAGNQSSLSNEAHVDTPAQNQPPSTPWNLQAVGVSETQINLEWNPSTDDGSVSLYRVYRDSALIGTSAVPTFMDTGLTAGSTYSYQIQAVDDEGLESALSSPVDGSTLVEDTESPSVPQGVQASILGGGEISLLWTESSDNVEIAFYRVYRDDSFLVDVQSLAHVDGTVVAGTSYRYRVEAFDTAGNGSGLSSEVTVTAGDQPDLDPDLWLGMGFEEEAGSLTFDISVNANDGVVDPEVVRSATGQFGRSLEFSGSIGKVDLGNLDIPGSATTISAWIRPDSFGIHDARIISKASGVNEEDHFWMLSTINSNGIKARARFKTETSSTITLIGSTNLQLAVWTHIAVTYDGSILRLYVNGILDSSFPLTGDITQDSTVAAAIGDQPQGERNFDGLIDDVRIYVRAIDSAGIIAIMSEPIAPVGVTDNEPPTVPVSLTASLASSTEAQLNWDESSDNIGVLGYLIYRDGVDVGSSLTTDHIDSGLEPSTTYAYTVAAFDQAGNESNPSNGAIVNTPASEPDILSNGDFESGMSSWHFYTSGSGSAVAFNPGFESSSTALVTISTVASNIQLYQNDISLEPNTAYRLTFAAYSSSGRDLRVSLSKHSSPYTNYGINRQRVDLTTGWETFTIEFTASGFNSPVDNGRLYFWFASDAKTGDVYRIDQVDLIKL